ncbi:hypothetical protein [Euzebya tangerina]|uniref:hypothetical protein n=1 Tax=Euzebya tangerina TaxID=591198 RepID=UPI0013C3073A|nr:hypothetical protein [Euzebya tangerina]
MTRTATPKSRTTNALVRALLVASLGLLLLPVPGSAQEGNPPGVGIRLLEAPAELADDPRAQNYVIDHVEAGTTIERDFEIGNGDPEDFEVSLYSAGAEITDSAFIAFDDDQQNDLASWISVAPDSLLVPSEGRVRSTLRIDVPENAADGERYAVVFAERSSADQGGLQLVQRVGIRVYLSVGDGPAPVSDFEITSFTAMRDESGEPGLEARIANTGGRALDLQGEVMLTDGPGGVSAGPFDVELGTTLAPGGSTDVQLLLDPELPDGPWLATLTVSSGTLEKQAQATITFPQAGNLPNVIEVDAPSRSGLDIGAGVIGGGAVGLPLWLLWRRRKKKKDEDEASTPADESTPADTATSAEREPAANPDPVAPSDAEIAVPATAEPRQGSEQPETAGAPPRPEAVAVPPPAGRPGTPPPPPGAPSRRAVSTVPPPSSS